MIYWRFAIAAYFFSVGDIDQRDCLRAVAWLRKRGRSTDRLGYVRSGEVGNPWQSDTTRHKRKSNMPIRCSSKKCKNHTPNDETRFNWSMPFVQVTSDRVIIDDVKTEIAYCFTCPLCKGEAEDFISGKVSGTRLK